jgi:mannose-6-phosphate isomerase-like protein (cupin superfamily)
VYSDVARVQVARFRDLAPSSRLFLDASIPRYERKNYMVMGEVGEDPQTRAAIPSADLHLGIVECAPGTGGGLHSHPTVEVFIALSGQWGIRWGDEGENEVVLEPFDAVAVPAGVMRGFRNVGTEGAHLLAVLTGRDAGEITWHPSVVEKVEKRQAT